MLDVKIEGATVIDGTGRPGARTDVGVRDEMIDAIGDLSRESAGTVLNASGRVLAPGFIDMHSHSDWRLWGNRRAESKIRQGVTTEVVGNCGFSPAPVANHAQSSLVFRCGAHMGHGTAVCRCLLEQDAGRAPEPAGRRPRAS